MNNGLGRTAIFILACCWCAALGQEPMDDETPISSVRELPLRGTYMKTEEGKLVWVPNFTWEKYKKWQDQELATGPPPYQINKLHAQPLPAKTHAQR